MTDHHPISAGAVFRAQLGAVGVGLRREALLAALALAGLTVWAVLDVLLDERSIDYSPDVAIFLALAGLVFPFAVWKGEKLFGGAYLWTLPVDRRRHALLKAAAGWVWLMAAAAVVVAWLVSLSLFTGGRLVGEQARLVMDGAGGLITMRWRDPAWMWGLPFTASTAGYLLGTAMLLGLKRPLWWAGGVIAAVIFMAEIGNAEDLVEWLAMGPLGLDYVISGGTDALDTQVTVGGETAVAWRAIPTAGRWLQATVAWLGLGLLAVWIAASRHRER